MNVLRQDVPVLTRYLGYGFIRKIHTAPQLIGDEKEKSLYEILRVSKDATQSEIKESYYKLSKVFHPDVKKDAGSLNMFRSITEAYDVLGHVKKRQEYDKKKYGKGEEYDTSKKAFYGTLYKDKVFINASAPDYDAYFDKRALLDKILSKEEQRRQIEVRLSREKGWEHQWDSWGEFGSTRSMLVLCFTLALTYGVSYFEDIYDWGLP